MGDKWFVSRSGHEWDLEVPTATDVHWPDVAEALAKTCRFGGHCAGFYSVAEHSIRVAELMPPELYGYGLLHDAAEAWIGDIILPLKHIIRPLLDPVEHAIETEIWKAARLPAPTVNIASVVKHYDRVMLATERRDLITTPVRPWRAVAGITPHPDKVVPFASWEDARQFWLAAFYAWQSAKDGAQ